MAPWAPADVISTPWTGEDTLAEPPSEIMTCNSWHLRAWGTEVSALTLWVQSALTTKTIAKKKKNLFSGLFISKIHHNRLLFFKNKEAEVASPNIEVSVLKGECWISSVLLLVFQTSSIEAKTSEMMHLLSAVPTTDYCVGLVNCQGRSGAEMLLSWGSGSLNLIPVELAC